MKRVIVMILAMVVVMGGLFAGEKKAEHGKSFIPTWERAMEYTIKMAELMPEKDFHFKPTKEVMSYAEQIVHIAGVNLFFVTRLTDKEPPKDRPKAEKMKKAEIIALLKKSFEAGKKAVANLPEKEAMKKIKVFGELHLTKMEVILLMRDHTTHHRGQMVVYLRLKGIKPADYKGW